MISVATNLFDYKHMRRYQRAKKEASGATSSPSTAVKRRRKGSKTSRYAVRYVKWEPMVRALQLLPIPASKKRRREAHPKTPKAIQTRKSSRSARRQQYRMREGSLRYVVQPTESAMVKRTKHEIFCYCLPCMDNVYR